MGAYNLIVFCVYIGILIYIIPTQWLTFDLYERKFRLLPNWFKILALVWLLVAVVIILVFKASLPKWDELLLSNINISLFIFFFSKQKEEDEFSEQIRFKAFTYSFVSIVAMFGAFGTKGFSETDGSWSNFMLHGIFSGGLLIATLYFYFTVYKLKKENN